MGRTKNYKAGQEKKNRSKKLRRQERNKPQEEMKDDDNIQDGQAAALSVGKKRQIFKKEKSKAIKQKIMELKHQSLKLKKKKLDEKAEKKKIAKEIHRLKASLKACEEIKKSGKDSEDSDVDMD
eukprot:403336455